MEILMGVQVISNEFFIYIKINGLFCNVAWFFVLFYAYVILKWEKLFYLELCSKEYSFKIIFICCCDGVC